MRVRGKGLLLAEEARKAYLKEKRAELAAAEQAAKAEYAKLRRRHSDHSPYALHASVVQNQLRSKQTPSASSQFGKFFCLLDPPGAERSKLFSQFTKLQSRRNRTLKDDPLFEHKMMYVMRSKKTIAEQDITNFLARPVNFGRK